MEELVNHTAIIFQPLINLSFVLHNFFDKPVFYYFHNNFYNFVIPVEYFSKNILSTKIFRKE